MTQEADRSFYGHMLCEDLHLGLMPARGTRSDKFQITLTPLNTDSIESVCFGLPNQHRERRDPIEAVSDFIKYVGQIISYDGEAFFEIVYFFDSESEKPKRFRLVNIRRETLSRRWKGFVQKGHYYINPGARNVPFRVNVPRESVALFAMPDILGGARRHRSVLKRLANLIQAASPQNLQNRNPDFQSDLRISISLDTTHFFVLKFTGLLRIWVGQQETMKTTYQWSSF